jgi:tRNA-(ms[2]io[6]A)-hydroxylase
MESEAGHYYFYYLCPKYGIDVEKRWREWINFEASVIENYGKMKLFMGRT